MYYFQAKIFCRNLAIIKESSAEEICVPVDGGWSEWVIVNETSCQRNEKTGKWEKTHYRKVYK